MPPLHRPVVAALAALALAVTACGPDEPSATPTTPEPPTTPAPTTTPPTTRPTTTTTTPPLPARVIVAGDSVVHDVAPAVAAALPAEEAEVVGMVAPALTTPATRRDLTDRALEAPTDVVVVMVGIWERAYTSGAGARLGDPTWEADYLAEVLDPFRQALDEAGTQLLLVRPPPMRDAQAQADLADLGDIWARYATTHPDRVTYLEASAWFDGAQEFVEVLPDPGSGVPVRVRRLDGIHLCEAGAVRATRGLLGALADLLDRGRPLAERPGWETGDWTERFPPDECPPPA